MLEYLIQPSGFIRPRPIRRQQPMHSCS